MVLCDNLLQLKFLVNKVVLYCSGPVEVEDYIVMNAKDLQLKMMEANMSERKAKAKAAKKGIKREVVDSEPGNRILSKLFRFLVHFIK